MNKPISTWTQTFYKLGYTLRRIWHDEPDYANNYTPLALEVLEDRQMLSGFGGDDPMGGGTGDTGGSDGSGDAGEFDNGPGSGANGGAIAGGNNELTEVNGASPGAGYSEYSALTLSTHWRTNAPASYAWNQTQTLPSYFGTHASGSNSGTVYHAEVKGFDTDLGTYLISFYTYDYTITVSRSSDLGGMGGPGQFGTSDWYKEHLSVTVTGSTIETTDQLIANDFLDNGQFDNFNSASFKSIGTHSGNANYTFTGTVNPNTSNTYSQIDVVLGEYFQQNYNYQTSVDSFWDRSGLLGNVEVSGTVQVSGGSHSQRNTTFDSSQTATGRNFNVSGSSSGASNDTINYQDASLTITTAGFEPVAIDNTTATMRPRNDDGTYATLPVEGSRYQLTLDGTQTTTSNFNTNFSGNGNILPQGSKTVRTGTVNYSASANSTITNDYVRTYTADQTILGATILYATSLQSGDVGRSIQKGGGQEIDIAVLHSYSQTTDKNRSESELKYNLKHEYQPDGTVKQTTQMVNSLTGLGLSFYRLNDDYNIETTYREIEQLQYNKPTENSTEFTRTHGTTKLTGPSSRLTTFATTITSAQPGFTHETTSTGQVFVTGTTDLTNVDTSTSIRSFKKQASVSMPANTAIELTLNGDGSVTSPPPMTGERTSLLETTVASGSTRRLHDTILRHWIYEADGVVKAHENSTFRSYNTAYWSTFDSTIKTSLDAADNLGNKHSDAYEQIYNTTTTAHGLGSMADLQDFWGSGDGAAIAAAAVGEASIVMQSLIITFTPRPTPPNEDDQDDDVQAVALGGSSYRAYDRTKSGTSTHIRAGSYSDAGHDDGFDRISGVRITPASATTISTHSDRDSWNKTPEGEQSYSLTDVYSFSTDNSFTIHTTGWSDVVGTDDGNVGYHTALGSQTGNATQGSAMQAIAADGQVVATDSQWNALADQMNDDSFDGFGEDFSLSRLIDTRDSSELSREGLRTEYNLTQIFTPKTFEVPVTSSDGTTGTDETGGAQTTVSSEGSTETRTVDGYEITNFGSTKVVVTSSYSIQHNSGHTELLYARQRSGGTYQYVPGQGFGTGANYRWLSNGRSTTDLASGGNSESYSSNATITTTYNSDGLIVIHTVSNLDSHTQSLATAKTTTSDRLWQDDYAAGHGRIAAARSSSLPPDGPNLSSSSNYKYDSELTLIINPNLFPPTTPDGSSSDSSGSSGSYDPNGGQSNYTPSGSGSSDSGSSSSGSSSPSNQGPNGPNLGEMYGNMRYGISQWDASDKGIDLIGTVTETSDSNFSHTEQLSQSSEDLMRMDGGSKVGAVKFDASSLEVISRETDSDLNITHEGGSGFRIDKASDEVKTNHKWTDKQIRSRSEHREYDTPTAAPPTTMAALRNSNATSNQSLLGDPPSGSQLVLSATSTTLYYSPLSDVTKTVKNWIAPYESDGSPNAAPILYRYLDEVEVDVTASVSKTGYHFNGSSTLHSKSTFTESDQGTIETYRGLVRQDGNSFNNWTVTYVPVETHTGGITQSITHTKPSADNTITIPNQGTETTVEPGGEYHSGTSLLSTYRTVQDAIIGFIGGFTSFTSYVSLGAVDSSGSDGNTENGLSTEQETGRIDEIIDEFKRRYPTESEYLKRYLKAGKFELAEMWFYNIHYKGGYDGTTRTDGVDVIYIHPDTDIGLAADLLLQYLHVMQHYGNSKFSSEMSPKVDVTTFLNNLEAAGVPLASGTRPYRVDMADLKLYNDMGVMAANLMPVVGTSIALSETIIGKSFAFSPDFVEELSPAQRVFTFTTVAGPVLVGVAYKVGNKVFVRMIGRASSTADAAILARFYKTHLDPARALFGPARLSHASEIAEMQRVMKAAGVEVRQQVGKMAYGPSPTAGLPGQFIIDPDASYSAWLHEYKHFLDDQASKWTGWRKYAEASSRWAWESRAFQEEINFARRYGNQELID